MNKYLLAILIAVTTFAVFFVFWRSAPNERELIIADSTTPCDFSYRSGNFSISTYSKNNRVAVIYLNPRAERVGETDFTYGFEFEMLFGLRSSEIQPVLSTASENLAAPNVLPSKITITANGENAITDIKDTAERELDIGLVETNEIFPQVTRIPVSLPTIGESFFAKYIFVRVDFDGGKQHAFMFSSTGFTKAIEVMKTRRKKINSGREVGTC